MAPKGTKEMALAGMMLASAVIGGPAKAGNDTLDSKQGIELVKAETRAQTQELLKQCDGIDRAGVIHIEKQNGEINGFAEKSCVRKIELAQLDNESEQLNNESEQLDKSIAMHKDKLSKMIEQHK